MFVAEQQVGRDRRVDIADAGIRIIATRGVRALTHRGIDAELHLAPGSTSYYARTRRDLVTLIVRRLAERSAADIDGTPLPGRLTVAHAATIIAKGLDAMMLRADDHLARIALHVEYRHDAEMLAALAGDPPVRPRLIAAAEEFLARLGTADHGRHAADFVALVDSLLWQRVVRDPDLDAREIIQAYLTGITSGR